MADHRHDPGIDQLLRREGAFLRVGLVVLALQFELDRLVADLDAAGRIDLVDRHARAVLVVLAQVRDAAGERGDVPDLDDLFGRCRCLGLLLLGWLFLLAAGGERDRDGERDRREFDHLLHSVLLAGYGRWHGAASPTDIPVPSGCDGSPRSESGGL